MTFCAYYPRLKFNCYFQGKKLLSLRRKIMAEGDLLYL